MSSGKGSSRSTQTVQNYSPAEAARRAELMAEAERVYNATKGQLGAYPGASPVGFDPATLSGQQSLLGAGSLANMTNPMLYGGLQYGLTGAMDVQNNPYFQGALEASLRPLGSQLTQGLQQVGSAAQSAGAYGGGRHGVAEALSFDKAAQAMGDVTARMGSEAYAQGQDTFARTLALAPQTMQAYGTGGQFQSAVGAQRENLAQQMEDYLAQARMWELNKSWMPLENYANIVYGGGGSQSTSTATSSTPRNPLQGAVGGAMAGYGMAGMLGFSGPVGMAAGAVLGALL